MNNMAQPIHNLNPHYTNERFKEAQTVWLAKGKSLSSGRYPTVKGAEYNYSDRIWQWNWEKARKATDVIDASLARNSAAYIQEFLRYYFDNPKIELVHVMAGFNLSNGYPYQVYGYITPETKHAT